MMELYLHSVVCGCWKNLFISVFIDFRMCSKLWLIVFCMSLTKLFSDLLFCCRCRRQRGQQDYVTPLVHMKLMNFSAIRRAKTSEFLKRFRLLLPGVCYRWCQKRALFMMPTLSTVGLSNIWLTKMSFNAVYLS